MDFGLETPAAKAVMDGTLLSAGGFVVVVAILGKAASTASIDVIVVSCGLGGDDVDGVVVGTLSRQRTNGLIVLDVGIGM